MKSKPNLSIEEASSQPTMDQVCQGYVEAINAFDDGESKTLNDDLEQFLLHVAKTGDTLTTWNKVKEVVLMKMKTIFDDFYEEHPYTSGKVHTNCENDPFEDIKERLLKLTLEFESPPFTIQRLCELITNPKKNYTKCEKFMRAVEKNLMVVSSWNYPPRRSTESTEQVNGGFDSRTSYNAMDRPWANLPHSPIASSAPVVPALLKQEEVDKDPPSDAAEPNTEEESESSETSGDAPPLADKLEKTTNHDSNESGGRGESGQQVPGSSTEAEDIKNDSAKASKESNDAEQEKSQPSIAATATKVPPAATGDSNANDNADGDAFKATPDSCKDELSNTIKDVNREPLPGVGTLVEKHSLIKCKVQDALPDKSAVTNKSDTPVSASTSSESSSSNKDFPTSCVPSPKRKLSDDDSSMDVESQTKRPKQEENNATMESVEEGE